jgi:hypothetical protein
VEFIKCHAAITSEDGKAAMGGIQQKAVEPGCLPADVARAIDEYCKDLGHRAALKELSGDLEKDTERERLTQLKAMEVEVSKFKIASEEGDMAGLMRVKAALSAQLKKYLDDIETDKEDGVSSDVTGKWKRVALDLTKDAMVRLGGMGRDVCAEGEDALGPLRRALGKLASLCEAMICGVSEPDEGGLRDLARRLGVAKKECTLRINQSCFTCENLILFFIYNCFMWLLNLNLIEINY